MRLIWVHLVFVGMLLDACGSQSRAAISSLPPPAATQEVEANAAATEPSSGLSMLEAERVATQWVDIS